MSVNAISGFRFVSLSAPPPLAQELVVVRRRPGVDGVMLQRLGRSARQYQVTSMADVTTFNWAYDIYTRYRLLVGANAVPIVWANAAIAAWQHLVYVTAVEPVQVKRIVRGHGGLNGTSYALLRCQWTLQPVEIT